MKEIKEFSPLLTSISKLSYLHKTEPCHTIFHHVVSGEIASPVSLQCPKPHCQDCMTLLYNWMLFEGDIYGQKCGCDRLSLLISYVSLIAKLKKQSCLFCACMFYYIYL